MPPVSQARSKLLNSAIELMYSRSYADVGVQELCEHADVKKGSFYHFFPSKRALTLAALDRQWEFFCRDVLDRAMDKKLSPLTRLERWFQLVYQHQVRIHARTGRVLGCPFGNLAVELSTQNEVIRRRVATLFRDMTAAIRRTLQEAVEVGEVGAMDTEATAQAVLAYMEGVALLAKSKNDPKVIRQAGVRSIRRLIEGMAGKARRPVLGKRAARG